MLEHGPGGITIIGEDYESKEFTVSNGSTNYNVKTQQSSFALRNAQAQHMVLRTDTDIIVRLNKTTKDAISVDGGSRLVTDGILITNIFITAAAGDAAVKILLS